MSTTPRTDEREFAAIDLKPSARVVYASFARQLETELADKDRQLSEITRQRNAYKKALEMAEDELMTVRAEIERLRGFIISQITPEPLVLSSYSATTEPAKDERDKLIEQMREIINDYRIEHKAWCNHDPDNAKECNCGLSEKVQAALAAES